jgi:hypothetical protein
MQKKKVFALQKRHGIHTVIIGNIGHATPYHTKEPHASLYAQTEGQNSSSSRHGTVFSTWIFRERDDQCLQPNRERTESRGRKPSQMSSLSTVMVHTVLYNSAETASSHNLFDFNFRTSSGGIGTE